jgi:SAM-dependent methyltransferase
VWIASPCRLERGTPFLRRLCVLWAWFTCITLSCFMADPYRNPNEPGFNPAYRGTPPWDIGRPQAEFVRLEETGEIQGSVLDVGCGTGEHVLYLAQRGHEAWGLDSAPLAIDKAKQKSAQRGIQATFVAADAFDLRALGRTFDTVIDSGLFHVFAPELRPRFVASLGDALSPGATYLMLGYSDEDPGSGPPGFSPHDIRRVFGEGWRINYVRDARFEIVDIPGHKTKAWLSSISRQ